MWGGESIQRTYTPDQIITYQFGFHAEDAVYSDANLTDGKNITFTPGTAGNLINWNGTQIYYSGDGNTAASGQINPSGVIDELNHEYLYIPETQQDFIFMVSGRGSFMIETSWDYMPYFVSGVVEGGGEKITIETQTNAQMALGILDEAININNKIRANLGAMQNRLENTVSNLQIQAENLQAAESRISDVDVATEMTELVRNQILMQASTAMLAQANSLPQMLISLLES